MRDLAVHAKAKLESPPPRARSVPKADKLALRLLLMAVAAFLFVLCLALASPPAHDQTTTVSVQKGREAERGVKERGGEGGVGGLGKARGRVGRRESGRKRQRHGNGEQRAGVRSAQLA